MATSPCQTWLPCLADPSPASRREKWASPSYVLSFPTPRGVVWRVLHNNVTWNAFNRRSDGVILSVFCQFTTWVERSEVDSSIYSVHKSTMLLRWKFSLFAEVQIFNQYSHTYNNKLVKLFSPNSSKFIISWKHGWHHSAERHTHICTLYRPVHRRE